MKVRKIFFGNMFILSTHLLHAVLVFECVTRYYIMNPKMITSNRGTLKIIKI